MKVLISGASGLIGSALGTSLRADGHEVATLTRREPSGPDEFAWDPSKGRIDTSALDGVDAVVHLAGASINGRRWTPAWQREILTSRVSSTTVLADAITSRPEGDRPSVLVSGSAIGFYGDTGEVAVDESGRRGEGFLADVVVDWEACARPVADAGVRTVLLRTGIVLSAAGGALGTVLPLFKFGVAGRLGSGRQWFSWISLPDEVAAIRFVLDHADVSGPVNLTAPQPVTNAAYTAAVGRALHRPAVVPVPAFALRVALGKLADEGALISQRVLPGALTQHGFDFAHPDIDAALQALLH